MASGESTTKYQALDGLRGIAALIVVFCHYTNGFLPYAAGISSDQHFRFEYYFAHTPAYLFISGNFAVCTFFVLSSFVLSAKFFSTPDGLAAHSLAIKGFIKRYFRLVVPVFGAVVISLLLLKSGSYHNGQTAPITGSANWLASFWTTPISWIAALKEIFLDTFIHTPPVGVTLDSSLWTMRIEFLGSLLLFGILLAVGRLPLRWLFYAILAVLFSHSYYLGFIIGLAISDIWHSQGNLRQYIPKVIGWPLLAAGLLLGSWAYLGPQIHTPYDIIQIPGFSADQLAIFVRLIAAACLVLSILLLRPIQTFFSLSCFRFLGRISFSLYLIHLLILGSFSCYLFNSLILSNSYLMSFVITVGASMNIIFISAWIFTRWIDDSAVTFSNRMGRLLTGNANGWHIRIKPSLVFEYGSKTTRNAIRKLATPRSLL